MKKRLFISVTLLFSVLTAQLCYAEENSQVSRITVDLTDTQLDDFEVNGIAPSFYHVDKKQSYLPKAGEEKEFLISLIGLLFCLLTILVKIKKLYRLNKNFN